MRVVGSLPEPPQAIGVEHRISRNQSHPFDQGGRRDQAVEGIAMMERQRCEGLYVLGRQR